MTDALLHLESDLLDGPLQGLARRHVVRGGVDGEAGELLQLHAAQGVDLGDGVDGVAPELDAYGALVVVRREDLDGVAAHPEAAAVKVDVVSLVLDLDQALQELVPPEFITLAQAYLHLLVRLGRADAVDARDRGDDDGVAPGQKAPGGGVAELVDLVVDRGVLFDEGVGGGDVGFRLVVIVVGDEVLDRVVGEELLELAVELGGQGFVGGEHEGGAVAAGDHLRHGEGLAGAGHPEQDLVPVAAQHPFRELVDGARLIAPRLEFRYQFEFFHGDDTSRRGCALATGDQAEAQPRVGGSWFTLSQ